MKHLDLSYLLENVTDDKDFIKQLLSVFLGSLDGDITALEDAVNEGDHGKVKRSAHKVKSSFRSLGMIEMTTRLQEIEDMGHSNHDIATIKQRYVEFKKDIPNVIDEVNAYIRS